MGRGAFKACIELLRPINSAMLGFAVIVGVAIVLGRPPNLQHALSAFLAGFFIGSAAMVLNDVVDVEVDSVNAPWRPLPSGRISRGSAIACFVAASLAGLLASTATGAPTLLVAALAWVLAVIYDVRGKRSGLPGNVIVAFNVAIPLLYGAALAGRLAPRVAVFWAMIFLSALAREVAKGIADVEGDSRAGVATVAATKGPRVAARLSLALYVAAIALSPLPAVMGWVDVAAYAPPIAVVDAVLAYSALRLASSPRREVALWHKRVVLAAMLLGLIGFYFGTSLS